MKTVQHTFGDGKYTAIFHESGKLDVLRYGEPWSDETGNGLLLAMLMDYDFLKEQSQFADMQIDSLLNEVQYLRDKLPPEDKTLTF
jgi:hypothetical protein